MNWNWEKPDWRNFAYDSVALAPLEQRFLLRSGEFIGVFKHIGADDQEKHRGSLNERQEKVIARLFREGIDGFESDLSAENYISITATSRATAARDLQDLIEKGAFTRTEELRHSRYHLDLGKP
jgi:Fic family protein